MNFPVFCAAVSAQGTVKATAGAVNVPISIGGHQIVPGDAIVADDDGVAVVPRLAVARTLSAARALRTRKAMRSGELGLDLYGLRETLAEMGVEYVDYESYRNAP
jgi:4-hydroxy-4-methyl-2-oxoglutarate aldolase